jgi:opacity protein-like surface antigen
MKKILPIISLFTLFTYSNAFAEFYYGFQLGVATPERASNITGNENVNFPNAPGNTNADDSVYYGATASDVELEDSPEIGAKFGYFFEKTPFLGAELEAFYTKPDFKEQVVDIYHPDFSNLSWNGGNDVFYEKQLGANVHSLTFALNAMFRYQKFEKVTPYFGIGPSLTFWKINASGCSGYLIGVSPAYKCGQKVNKIVNSIGLNVKTGFDFKLNDKMALNFEYKYNETDLDIGTFRSFSDTEITFRNHIFATGITYSF